MKESRRTETPLRSGWASGMVMVTLLLTLFPIGTQAEVARWDIDPDHSAIEFRVAHMVVSKTSGRFRDYRGFVEMDADAKTLKSIEATIKAGSIDTNHDKRDAHLRDADFLDVDQFPTMTYKMKQYQKQEDIYTIIGDLTLRGVTKAVTLSGTFNGITKDPWGNTRAGFSADGTINRKDFGMVWNKVLDSGGLVVGDEVHIHLDIECIKARKPS
ncbi:YceI family protein [Nitrospira sp. BLG_2]|uniref:YceI family protein n=1 Tax=Nitrospira sp. BLG_2 TaxID=3397507 RepID=UPI003B9AB2DD